jgi:hypothetical protein
MRHHGVFSAGEDRRHQPVSLISTRVSNRVRTAEDPMQAADLDSVVDHIVAQAKEAHLLPGDGPVLLRRKLPQAFAAPSGASFPRHIRISHPAWRFAPSQREHTYCWL